MLKYKEEWALLLETGRANRLSKEEIILLFAIREIEDGPKGNEFKSREAQDTNLAAQSDAMAGCLQKGEFIYQKYCKGLLPGYELLPGDEPIDFINFLAKVLYASKGELKSKNWVYDIKDKIKEINKELGDKNDKQ